MKRSIYIVLLFALLAGTSCQRRASRYYGDNGSVAADYSRRGTKQNTSAQSNSNRRASQQRTGSGGGSHALTGQEIFKRYSPAVFMVFTSTGHEYFQGSGFFISADGLAVSNYHVFEGTSMGAEVIVLSDGTQLKLDKVIAKDKENDLMVFRVASSRKEFAHIPISNRQVQVGDKAYAIGSPKGLENTFSSGEISQLRGNNVIQINVPIDHGSSGGALMNEYGEVIGVTSGGYDTSGANLNFAISIDPIKRYISR